MKAEASVFPLMEQKGKMQVELKNLAIIWFMGGWIGAWKPAKPGFHCI